MNDNLKLQAWVDGELFEDEARCISGEIARDAEAGGLVAELKNTRDALVSNELARTLPETREFYWSKIQREIQRREPVPAARATPRAFRWKHWLAPLAGIVGLACVVTLTGRPSALPAIDETSSVGGGMEAVTFHDQSSGMTVVWLENPSEPSQAKTSVSALADPGEIETE